MKKSKSCYNSRGKLEAKERTNDFPEEKSHRIDCRKIITIKEFDPKIAVINAKRAIRLSKDFSLHSADKRIEYLNSRSSQTTKSDVFDKQGTNLPPKDTETPGRMIEQATLGSARKIVLRQSLGEACNKPVRAKHRKFALKELYASPSTAVVVSGEPIEGIGEFPLRRTAHTKTRSTQIREKEDESVGGQYTSVEKERSKFLASIKRLRDKRIESICVNMALGMGDESALTMLNRHFGAADAREGLKSIIGENNAKVDNDNVKLTKRLPRIRARSLSAKEKSKRIKQYGRWYIDPRLYEARLKFKLFNN